MMIIIFIIINDVQIIAALSWITLQGNFTELIVKTTKRSATG